MKKAANKVGDASFQQVHDNTHPEDRQAVSIVALIQQIKETADKLIRDGANRGDVKLLTTALKELHYAFKVFSPYKGRRKVTVFGSARLSRDHPAYKQAVKFGPAQALRPGSWLSRGRQRHHGGRPHGAGREK